MDLIENGPYPQLVHFENELPVGSCTATYTFYFYSQWQPGGFFQPARQTGFQLVPVSSICSWTQASGKYWAPKPNAQIPGQILQTPGNIVYIIPA